MSQQLLASHQNAPSSELSTHIVVMNRTEWSMQNESESWTVIRSIEQNMG